MGSKFWPKGGLPGILHHYTETLVTFEYTSPAPKPHALIFVGGLGDGLATTSYMVDLVSKLAPTPWSLFTLNLSSSYGQWGTGHLDRDTDELAECISYISAYKASQYAESQRKVVVMGHSTGSQVVLHYLKSQNPHQGTYTFDKDLVHVQRPVLDGAIMQAPVSDRQAVHHICQEGFGEKTPTEMQAVYDELVKLARAATDDDGDSMAPLHLSSAIYPHPISYRRFLSLCSPDSPDKPGDDDLFSSDLSDEFLKTTFGMVATRGLLRGKLMVLYSEKDASVPAYVDKLALMKRWQKAADEGGEREGRRKVWDDEFTAVVPNASHALSNDDQAEPRRFLAEKVLGYLTRVEREEN
ncbi:probable hydrolases or acyltransferases (alpha/beta hydrolase superfamily) [Rhynchosporium agropyri]|uniref:Probable hydrolases or acyltransferases (Alpha/beta hydrolase superfamily) n=1 Tax=Rhynchosporium agropyri TaxID=914238 RepID=A0A1E1KZ67_9HELO|nr:probable hydrolases or acyltransferases (alpha/beta hydrolase superfamily) [Rhynchosporium agropyri]